MTNIKLALAALKEGQLLKIMPHGTSMIPTFRGDRDEAHVAPSATIFDYDYAVEPQKNDIAVYLRQDGTYVIHRILRIVNRDGQKEYYMVGDHQEEIEGPLKPEQIHGVVMKIVRKGKDIDCRKDFTYNLWVKFWVAVRPIRFKFIWVWWKVKGAKRRLLKR